MNYMKIRQEDIVACLLEEFEERLEEKDVDEEAEIVMEKCLYLLLQAVFCNF